MGKAGLEGGGGMGGGGMDPHDLFSQLFGGGGGFFGGGGGKLLLVEIYPDSRRKLTIKADLEDLNAAKISFTVSPSASKTCTKAKSRSSLYPNRSSAKAAKVEAAKRVPSKPVRHAEDKVSRSCSVKSVLWSNKSNNHVTNVRVPDK